ncbi:hypothetical protein NFI96_023246 [Prochilodus magdalenae]|nr:hypothetical protein NFI96_023246 [Prochilodus magdalenae]
MKAISPVRSVRSCYEAVCCVSEQSLSISRSRSSPCELSDMNDCYSKLKELVPSIPQDKSVSQVEILQHVIDYIFDLQIALENEAETVKSSADVLRALQGYSFIPASKVQDSNFSAHGRERRREGGRKGVKGVGGHVRGVSPFRLWEKNLHPAETIQSLVTGHFNTPKLKTSEVLEGKCSYTDLFLNFFLFCFFKSFPFL